MINNSRSEPGVTSKTLADASRDDRANKNTIEGHIAASEKRIADYAKAEEDEFGDFSLSADDLVQLDTPSKTTAHQRGADLETPRKVVKFDTAMTPGSKRKSDEMAWPTPQTGNNDVFSGPALTRLKGSMWDGNKNPGLVSPAITPTPSRFRDALQGQPEHTDYDVTTEVMDMLQGQNVDEETSKKLKEVLNKHALKTSGIAKGRDISRLALKSKDAKIAELQQRISALETEREMDKVVIRNIKDDITRSVSARRGRERGRGQT